MKKPSLHFILTLSVLFVVFAVKSQDTLEVSPFEMDNCVQLFRSNESAVISSRKDLDSLIRNDASRSRCVKMLKGFDIESYSLLGTDIHSGYCRFPVGLNYTVIKLESDKTYLVEITYIEPNEPCRAFSSYHLWLQVPKLVEGYEVEFSVKSVEER